MGMFSKNDSAGIEQQIHQAENKAISSIIDSSMKIKGEISFKGKARVDGQIDGNIDGEHLVLSEAGIINGDVIASSFICQGKIEGNIKAELVTAKKTCTIMGKLESGSLTVEPGATITGEIKTAAAGGTKSAKTPPASKPVSTAASKK